MLEETGIADVLDVVGLTPFDIGKGRVEFTDRQRNIGVLGQHRCPRCGLCVDAYVILPGVEINDLRDSIICLGAHNIREEEIGDGDGLLCGKGDGLGAKISGVLYLQLQKPVVEIVAATD